MSNEYLHYFKRTLIHFIKASKLNNTTSTARIFYLANVPDILFHVFNISRCETVSFSFLIHLNIYLYTYVHLANFFFHEILRHFKEKYKILSSFL